MITAPSITRNLGRNLFVQVFKLMLLQTHIVTYHSHLPIFSFSVNVLEKLGWFDLNSKWRNNVNGRGNLQSCSTQTELFYSLKRFIIEMFSLDLQSLYLQSTLWCLERLVVVHFRRICQNAHYMVMEYWILKHNVHSCVQCNPLLFQLQCFRPALFPILSFSFSWWWSSTKTNEQNLIMQRHVEWLIVQGGVCRADDHHLCSFVCCKLKDGFLSNCD